MATSKEFHDYVMEQLSRIGGFTSRKMMGEYCVYYRGRMAAEICDNQLLLKPTDSALSYFPDSERAYPYEGSKTLMIVVENVEDVELLGKAFSEMYDELPEPKKRK